jgi:alternate signal-mediated exported protein
MQKTTKGALALGTGVALLLGGAGTFAYWNGTADLGSNTQVAAGNLTIAAAAGANDGWAWQGDGAPFDPENDMIVPGDTVTLTRTFAVTATGNNLSADVAITGVGGGTSALIITPVVTSSGGTVVGSTFNIPASRTGATRTLTYTVTYTIAFPLGESVDNSTQNARFDLSGTTVTVTQVQP